jgi:hypothetical protein
LNIADENALQIYERKICDGVWRIKSNTEINSLFQGEDIVKHAKCLWHSWLNAAGA